CDMRLIACKLRDEDYAETDREGLDAGDAVDPIHEVVEVDEPRPEQHRGDAIGERGQQALENRGSSEQIRCGKRGGDEMRGETPAEGEAAEIVIPGDEGEGGGEGRDAEDGARCKAGERQHDPREENDWYQRDAAAARRRAFMRGALAGMVKDG